MIAATGAPPADGLAVITGCIVHLAGAITRQRRRLEHGANHPTRGFDVGMMGTILATTTGSSAVESAELTNDEAFRELSKIAVALMELPEDDYEQRLTLRQRRQEIKDLIAERPMSPEDVVSMRRELKGMRRQREAILDERPNIAAMNDGGQGGAGMAENQRLGWDYDEGTARNAIEERILDLERRIAETGH